MFIERLSEKYIDQFVVILDEYREFCGFNASPQETKEFFKNILLKNEATIFIAMSEKDEVMGFINLYPSYSSLALKRLWILNDLGVSRKFRRLGVAQALIKKSISFAKQSGAIRIELKTEKLNLHAQKLYSEMGFKTDQEHVYYRVAIQ